MLAVIKDKDDFNDLVYQGELGIGEVVFELEGEIINSPTRTSIQISETGHIEDEWGQFMNHNCYPSCEIAGTKVIALENIKKGDSLTFDYNKSETKMSHPFHCHCCNNLVEGSGK